MKTILKKRNHKLREVYPWAVEYSRKKAKERRMGDKSDFSAEDDVEAQESFEKAATAELERLKASLKKKVLEEKEAFGSNQSK